MRQSRFNLVPGTVKPQIEICKSSQPRANYDSEKYAARVISGVWKLEAIPQALCSGNFHCDNGSGLLLRPGMQSSPEAAGIGKEVVFPARSKRAGGSCLDTSREEERQVRFLGVCPSLLLDCLPYRAILPFSLTLQDGSWFF